jgi:hypothetical protein
MRSAEYSNILLPLLQFESPILCYINDTVVRQNNRRKGINFKSPIISYATPQGQSVVVA